MNRGLRELCLRSGLTVPPELEFTHSKQNAAAAPGGGGSATAVANPGAVAGEQRLIPSLNTSSSSLGESRSLGVSGSFNEARPHGQ